jgi:hypothetical protein
VRIQLQGGNEVNNFIYLISPLGSITACFSRLLNQYPLTDFEEAGASQMNDRQA